ncbi:hypothetical protein SAMN05428997_13136 [Bosea sp. CRIB-10]|nr:hypothetical protein SAMN05428997_13136 [Bosea sp. CRIB-10]
MDEHSLGELRMSTCTELLPVDDARQVIELGRVETGLVRFHQPAIEYETPNAGHGSAPGGTDAQVAD